MTDTIKKMDLKEFRDKGYLMEVNRQFFHPLGLALEMEIDDETEAARLSGIWDYREDLEGIIFAEELLDELAREKSERIAVERSKKSETRLAKFGWIVQPIGEQP